MRTGSMMFAGAVAILLAASNGLQAQAGQGSTPGQAAAKGKTVQLTGCLAKGTDANSFMLNNATEASASKDAKSTTTTTTPSTSTSASAAKSYHLMPKDVKLDAHVGHQIQITGTMDEAGAAGAAKSGAAGTTGAAGKMADSPHVTVTAMKHIAAKCS